MTFTHQFYPSVLREYDIRGIVDETLSVYDARAVGRLFGTTVRRNGGVRVCVRVVWAGSGGVRRVRGEHRPLLLVPVLLVRVRGHGPAPLVVVQAELPALPEKFPE